MAQILVLVAFSGVAIISLMAIPTDDNPMWFISFFSTKALAAAGFYAICKLEPIWRPGNKWLQAYHRACVKAEETPNSMYTVKKEKE